MTRTHYRHRFARSFGRLAGQHPDLSLQQLFQLCHHQMLEDRIAEVLAEANRLSTRYHLTIIRRADETTDVIPYRRRHTQRRISNLLAQEAALSVRRDRSARRVGHLPITSERVVRHRGSLRE